MNDHVLLTGGAGYIGSHVALVLLQAGYDVTIIDNFYNSSPEAVSRVRKLTNREVSLIEADLADRNNIAPIIENLKDKNLAGTVHLAGLKAVGESVEKPGLYYEKNLNSTLNLVEILDACDARTVVFSSSATVYGDRNKSPVDENGLTGPTNPYGMTKLFNEQILADQYHADNRWKVINLRYFNPVGAHPSGVIGEDPLGIPNNLFPFIAQVAVGRRDKLNVFGDDYATRDGTGIRDYIHVMDLAEGHEAALSFALNSGDGFLRNINLGSGQGHSVLEVVKAWSSAAGKDLPYEIVPRRSGDIAEIFADAALAKNLLGWQTQRSLEDMCADHWRWQSSNPHGYGEEAD